MVSFRWFAAAVAVAALAACQGTADENSVATKMVHPTPKLLSPVGLRPAPGQDCGVDGMVASFGHVTSATCSPLLPAALLEIRNEKLLLAWTSYWEDPDHHLELIRQVSNGGKSESATLFDGRPGKYETFSEDGPVGSYDYRFFVGACGADSGQVALKCGAMATVCAQINEVDGSCTKWGPAVPDDETADLTAVVFSQKRSPSSRAGKRRSCPSVAKLQAAIATGQCVELKALPSEPFFDGPLQTPESSIASENNQSNESAQQPTEDTAQVKRQFRAGESARDLIAAAGVSGSWCTGWAPDPDTDGIYRVAEFQLLKDGSVRRTIHTRWEGRFTDKAQVMGGPTPLLVQAGPVGATHRYEFGGTTSNTIPVRNFLFAVDDSPGRLERVYSDKSVLLSRCDTPEQIAALPSDSSGPKSARDICIEAGRTLFRPREGGPDFCIGILNNLRQRHRDVCGMDRPSASVQERRIIESMMRENTRELIRMIPDPCR